MLKKILFVFVTAFVLFSAQPVRSEEGGAIPKALDPEYRHKKAGQFEVYPFGGSYLGAMIDQTWTAGAKIYLHLNNTVALGGSYSFSKLYSDATSSFGSTLNSDNLHIANFEMMVSNDVAMRVGKRVLEMDLYFTLGVGGMLMNEIWEPVGLAGGGLKIYTGLPWLAARVDVNNYIHATPLPGRESIDCDTVFIGGFSFLFPIKH